MGKIYMTACMKGGCAKTVTTYNLEYSLKELGKKVLCVDFDSQANLSTCFGVENPAAVPVTIGHLMMAQIDDDELPGFKEYIRSRNGVDFISSSMMLSAVDAKLRLEMGAEKMLSEILEPLRDRYDAIIIDTAPTLGALNINALAAADEVIITVNPQLLAMMGLQDFIKTVKKIRTRVNDRLSVAGILLTMCDARTNLCKVITEQVRDTFEGQIRIFESWIPNTVKVGESVYYSEPLIEYAPESNATKAYKNLAKELIIMKANANKRKIFDAVDLLTEDTSAQTTVVKAENGIEQIAIDSIKAFHNHPFHLYEGERLNDMVESIREHGILNPVIVLKTDNGYEMLSGHNRANAAKIAGLSEVPAIIRVLRIAILQ